MIICAVTNNYLISPNLQHIWNTQLKSGSCLFQNTQWEMFSDPVINICRLGWIFKEWWKQLERRKCLLLIYTFHQSVSMQALVGANTAAAAYALDELTYMRSWETQGQTAGTGSELQQRLTVQPESILTEAAHSLPHMRRENWAETGTKPPSWSKANKLY